MLITHALLLVLSGILGTEARPQNGNGNKGTAQQQAAKIPQGTSKAKDGSTILDTNATINGLNIRYRVSAPLSMFSATSGVPGATGGGGGGGGGGASNASTTTTSMGLNVLLHGDGGQSFFAFPNQNVQNNLMGVAVLAPDPNLFWGGGSGLQRTNGVAHAQAVNDLVTRVLPQTLSFNQSNVYFTGVSGGSLLLSGYFVPAHMANFKGAGVLLNCGAMPPQVAFVDAPGVLASTRIHYQSTKQELAMLQTSIPAAIKAYEQAATGQAGVSAAQVGGLQTANNDPNGGHCAFDGKDFASGIQLVANSYAAVMQPGGNGTVPGIGNVLKTVVGNENLVFTGSNRRSMAMPLTV